MNTSTSKWGLSRTTSCMGESPEQYWVRGEKTETNHKEFVQGFCTVPNIAIRVPIQLWGWKQKVGWEGSGRQCMGCMQQATLAMELKMSLKKMSEELRAILVILKSASQAM